MKSYRPARASGPTPSFQGGAQGGAGTSNSDQVQALEDERERELLASARIVSELPGAEAEPVHGFGVHQSALVEHRSDVKQDATNQAWHTMNEDYSYGYTFDHAEKGTPGSTPVNVGYPGEKGRKLETEILDETDIHTLGDYRAMVQRDFNFSGVVNTYIGGNRDGRTPREVYLAGVDAFLKDVVARFYPGKQLDDPDVQVCKEIARNIWSYATTGMDVSGTTDVAEMQGLLYVFDRQIRGSSDTNTVMEDGEDADDYFILPGTEEWEPPIKLLKGDGRHGRATILTTRHLLGSMTTLPPRTGLEGFDETYMAIDKSGSMQVDEFQKLGRLIAAGGITGEVALGGFDGNDESLAKVQDGEPLGPGEAKDLLMNTGREAINNRQNGTSGFVKGASELGAPSGKANHEEGLANALEWANSLPPYDGKTLRQIVVVTDAPDFNPSVLMELKEVAVAKHLQVKVLYSFNSAEEQTGHVEAGNSDRFVVIDVLKIEEILDAWLIDREGAAQLDWYDVAKAQGAEEQSWADY